MTATRTERLRAVKDEVAIVGVGETDYGEDYRRARAGEVETDGYGYAATALRRALADAGIERAEVDGLVVGPTLALERLGEVVGIDARWSAQADAGNAVVNAVLAIHAGLADCVALVYGNDQRSAKTAYGGPDARATLLAYVYYASWGLTSQGALYAMLANRYMEATGFSPRDLGAICVAQRRFAQDNPNAVMRSPLTLEQYEQAPFICEPLRLYDYCLVNDGGVALILVAADRVRSSQPVLISGIGRSDLNRGATQLRPRLLDFYRSAQAQAAEQVYEMAGHGPADVDLLQVYDSFSLHVALALDGFGFVEDGDVGAFVRDGNTGPGGRLPVNTSGGHLSDSYMQGWNHQVEAVRQLRGEAGARQVKDAARAQYVCDAAGKVTTLIYTRGGA